MLCLEIKKEARTGFEPGNQGFADPRLTAWLCHQIIKFELTITVVIISSDSSNVK